MRVLRWCFMLRHQHDCVLIILQFCLNSFVYQASHSEEKQRRNPFLKFGQEFCVNYFIFVDSNSSTKTIYNIIGWSLSSANVRSCSKDFSENNFNPIIARVILKSIYSQFIYYWEERRHSLRGRKTLKDVRFCRDVV